ncbi:hypothetical protein AML60_25485 [Escherichia coli]|jgi:hypothetical protein|nr:hypothetical protein AML60_25485 [Escherichia coli]
MHWENIQKRAQTSFNAIFAGGQGFARFFVFRSLRGVLGAFPGLCYGNPRLTAFSLTRNAHVMFNAVRFCCPVVGRMSERVSIGLRGLMIVEMRKKHAHSLINTKDTKQQHFYTWAGRGSERV